MTELQPWTACDKKEPNKPNKPNNKKKTMRRATRDAHAVINVMSFSQLSYPEKGDQKNGEFC
jgi:hypothetical protein